MSENMALRPHDLLRMSDAAALQEFRTLPEWAHDAVRAFPVVVVRRARGPEGFVPVGIRGRERNQRAAALLPLDAVVACISPEQLARSEPWLHSPWVDSKARATVRQLRTLRQVAEAARREGLIWGPVGSAGFELATSAPVIREESDLDILVRYSPHVTMPALRRFRDALTEAPVEVDVVLERDGCAVAMIEYLLSPRHVLMKTMDGPKLGDFAGQF